MAFSFCRHPGSAAPVPSTGLSLSSLASRCLPGRTAGQQCGQSLDRAGWGMVRKRGQLGHSPGREIWSVVFEGDWPDRFTQGLTGHSERWFFISGHRESPRGHCHTEEAPHQIWVPTITLNGEWIGGSRRGAGGPVKRP